MGEVYRARDTRLDRTVAIKVLPSELSDNTHLRLRFEQEAKAISALNHPHICALYDVGKQDGTEFLVMEYLEGETLAQRLGRGPLPLNQVLRYAIQIAEALEKAHRQHIVHRDLKPSNIMLTRSGAKLLDFGLAKLRQTEGGPLGGLSVIPTAQQPLTAQGTILGTIQYMAPEQLEGTEADARTDIFGFGAVLYEMATGRKAFEGKSKTSLIAAIVSGEPAPMSQLQPLTPPALERLVRVCLAKDPDDRWQTAHDVLLELRWIEEPGSLSGARSPVVALRKKRETAAWIAAAIALVLSAALAAVLFRKAREPIHSVHASILPPEKTQFAFERGAMALSPDGNALTFVARSSDGREMLYVRPLSGMTAQPLAGTEGAAYPFWSPDSRSIGFFAGGKLKKISAAGGHVQSICEAVAGRGGSWSSSDVIIFAPNTRDPIHQVSASGGASRPVTTVEGGRIAGHRWPSFLPDGKHFLYVGLGLAPTGSSNGVVFVGSLEPDEEEHALLEASSNAIYSNGHVLAYREGSLVAHELNLDRLKVRGEAIPVAENVQYFPNFGYAIFSASDHGELAYQKGIGGGVSRLVLMDRAGNELETLGGVADYYRPRFSPDEKRIAVDITDPQTGNNDIWIYDIGRRISTRFTFSPESDTGPMWSPDGNSIVFTSARSTLGDLYIKPATGTGTEELLVTSPELKAASSWSEDGRIFSYMANHAKTKFDVWIWSAVDQKTNPILVREFNDASSYLSPDGRWMAWTSDETGRNEVYVQQVPTATGQWQISANGGTTPVWSRTGDEIFYFAPDETLIAVEVKTSPSFEAGQARTLFRAPLKNTPGRRYDVSRDGKRILINARLGDEIIEPITLVVNWGTALRH